MQNRSADIPTKDNRRRVKMIYFRFVRCPGKKQIVKIRSRIFVYTLFRYSYSLAILLANCDLRFRCDFN